MVMYLGDFCFNIDIFYCLKSKLLQCCNILILNVNTADFGEEVLSQMPQELVMYRVLLRYILIFFAYLSGYSKVEREEQTQ